MSTQLSLKNEEAEFNALKKAAEDLAAQCNAIVISDPTTLAIANQNLSLLKDKMKHVEELHKNYKAPYLEITRALDKLKNDLYNPMEDAFKNGKYRVLEYEKAEQRKAQEEIDRINGIRTRIQSHSSCAIQAMDSCKTIPDLDLIYRKWVKAFPPDEIWGEFLEEAKQMRLNLKSYAMQRKIQIDTPLEADEEGLALIKEELQETTFIPEAPALKKIKGLRETWKFQVVDENLIPRQWLMPDKTKIDDYLQEHKGVLKDGEIKAGVRFYIDQTITVR